jgi:hypothetical protein
MDPRHKLQHRAEQELAHTKNQQQDLREFGSTEELIQFDKARTAVPPEIEARLRQSMALEPQPKKGWWTRLFGS